MTKEWNLSSAAEARDFLSTLRFGPHQGGIKFLTTATGFNIPLEHASDEQVLQVARELAEAFCATTELPN